SVATAIVLRDGRALLERRSAGSLAGLWVFPAAEAPTAEAARRGLARDLRSRGIRLASGPPAARATHTIMRRRLEIEIFLASVTSPAPSGGAPVRWLGPAALERSATPALTRKIARAAGWARAGAA